VTALAFIHQTSPTRVVFEPGGLSRIGAEAALLGLERLLVLSTSQQSGNADQAAAALGTRFAGSFSGAAMHTPVDVTDLALAELRKIEADGLVAIGGGSAVGLAKALALRTDLPQIVVPTTYAGSEATPILGETKGALKTTQRSLKVLPEVILYDVDLTLGLPVSLSVSSGLNAIAHAAEALYAPDGNPLITVMAEEGVRALAVALPRIHAQPDDRAARSEALYGAWLCGTCLGAVGMALHHKICHTLGGTFGLPHAETHAVMLPHALAYNLPSARDAGRRLSRALNGQDPALALHRLGRSLGAPTALRDLGMAQGALDQAADLAVQNPYANPRPIERPEIRAMLARAWSGDPPADWGFEAAAPGSE
jgi:alcohol dehydrogenase class IV